MAGLAELRARAAGALETAGLNAFDHVPERVVPPVAVVLPDQPYVIGDGEGDPPTMCGTFRVRLRVNVLGGRGTNDQAANQLDQLLTTALLALESAGFDVGDVAEPAEVELNGAGFLGTVISLSDLVELEDAP